MKKTGYLFFLIFLLSSPFVSRSEVALPAIFSNNMVLQQNAKIRIWGWADPWENAKVSVSWLDTTFVVKGDRNASWSIWVNTPAAGGPFILSVDGKDNTVKIENILIGEVWLCAGQSNMEWSAHHGVKDALEELPVSRNNRIRMFKMSKQGSPYPQTDVRGRWAVCDSAALRKFSAVGYFFGKALEQELKVPIGLIDVAWGGSYIESWIPGDLVKLYPETDLSLQLITPSTHWPHREGFIYNGMIHPIANFEIAGVIWYQGESNTHYPSAYYTLQKQLIESWRGVWQKELPFYYVQIAPFHYKNDSLNVRGAQVREMQTKALEISRTGMAVTTDLVENLNDVHPLYKKKVGDRLAANALFKTYHVSDIRYQSPRFRGMDLKKGGIQVFFTDVSEEGLLVIGNTIKEFELAGKDGRFFKANAILKDKGVWISSEEVKDPVEVRFAYSNAPSPNLFDKKSGLPVVPFRTDSRNNFPKR